MRLVWHTLFTAILVFGAGCVGGASTVGMAEEDAAQAQGAGPDKAMVTVTPIYSQLVRFSLPNDFITSFEQSSPIGNYLREAVPKGETVDHWTQMITITGARNFAVEPANTPQSFTLKMAAKFQRHCPETFFAKPVGLFKVSGHDALMSFIGCGTIHDATNHSETLLLITMQGDKDIYTLQWAERGPASPQPIQWDEAKWMARSQLLLPIKLCPILPGEAEPYPSCLN